MLPLLAIQELSCNDMSSVHVFSDKHCGSEECTKKDYLLTLNRICFNT